MKDEHILAISVRLTDKIYKVASVIRSKDKSFYVAFPIAKNWQSTYGHITNIKFSYHPSGKNHMKARGNEEFMMIFPDKPKLENISDIIPTEFGMSFWDIKSINSNTVILDESSSRHNYKHTFEIDANKYQHLTINFFLGKLDSKLDGLRCKSKEICIIPLDDIQLIITTKDKWSGKNQTPQQQV